MTSSSGEDCPFEDTGEVVRFIHPHGGVAVVEPNGGALVLTRDSGAPLRVCALGGLPRLLRAVDSWLDAKRWTSDRVRVPPAPRMGRDAAAAIEGLRSRVLGTRWPLALAVEAAVAALQSGRHRLLSSPAFYTEPYLASDVVRYRGAAIALAFLESVFLRTTPAERAQAPTGADGKVTQQPLPVATLLDRLSRWRQLYSPTGESSRSLNRTLMNLPAATPARLVCELRRVHLERPVTTPLALAALAWRAHEGRERRDLAVEQSHLQIFQRANDADVARSVDWVAEAIQAPLDPAVQRDLRTAVRFLRDYPDAHHGPLVSLARAAAAWHRMSLEDGGGLTQAELDCPTGLPPIALPDVPGIRFLDSVRAVVEEGARMGHCVATYRESAVRGSCFLFHVTLGKDEATACVTRRGTLTDAHGPKNRGNRASVWGARQLGEWAAGFRARWKQDDIERVLVARRTLVARLDQPVANLDRPERRPRRRSPTAPSRQPGPPGWQQLTLWPARVSPGGRPR